MKIIISILIITNLAFAVIIDNKYILDKNSLSSLMNSKDIYSFIQKQPYSFKKMPSRGFFDFSYSSSIDALPNSSYESFDINNFAQQDYIYIKIPTRIMKRDFNTREYRRYVGNKRGRFFILKFKKILLNDKKPYLKLQIGTKKVFTLNLNDSTIKYFVKKHSNILFDRPDFIDDLTITNNKIEFITNYTIEDMRINYALNDYIKLKNKTLISAPKEKRYLIKLNDDLPSLSCKKDLLFDYINIDDEEFAFNEFAFTNNIYAKYLLDSQDRFSRYLQDKIKIVKIFSELKNNIHTISYTYKQKKITIKLNLPRNISPDIENKYISNFNSFKFKINNSMFTGYLKGQNQYYIEEDFCQNSDDLNIINTKNYSEFKKWDLKITDNTIIFTPNYLMKKISPVTYAPFLLKKSNKYVIGSQIDEESVLNGLVKYSYDYKNIKFTSYDIINPKTNTNIYFKYPKNENIENILKKTKFIYNSNPLNLISVDDKIIKFEAKRANKLTLIYYPTGNVNSFRKYFLRHFDCNKEEIVDDETCFNYLADMENQFGFFVNNLRKENIYEQILYRKYTYNEKEHKNLLSINQRNRIYEQAEDEEVLGGTYDRYSWNLNEALRYDNDILKTYSLSNIDLIYFSSFTKTNLNDLEYLKQYNFGNVFIVNFGEELESIANKYKDFTFIKHQYNKTMMPAIREFDKKVFDQIITQIKRKYQ